MGIDRAQLEEKWRRAGLEAACAVAEREEGGIPDALETDYAAADAAAEVVLEELDILKGGLLSYIDTQAQGIQRSSLTSSSEGALQAFANVRKKVEELF